MIGTVQINQIRDGKIIKAVNKRNTISNHTTGLKFKIINHMIGGSGGGSTAGIYLA